MSYKKLILTSVAVYAFVPRITRAHEGWRMVRARAVFTWVVVALHRVYNRTMFQ